MKESALPTPGVGSKSQHLRRIATAVISSLEVTAPKYTSGAHPSAAALKAFFDACSVAANEVGKINPTMTFTATTNPIAVAGTTATTVGKGGSAGALSYASSNTAVATVNASTGVVTGVASGKAVITATMAATATYRGETITLEITVS